MAKNHYHVPGWVPLTFDPPAIDNTPSFATDVTALVSQDDTLVRLRWWAYFAVVVTGGTVTTTQALNWSDVSVAAAFYPDGFPGSPEGPWDGPTKQVVSRASLLPVFHHQITNPSNGAVTGFAQRWSTPAEGIGTATNHKGTGVSLPVLEFTYQFYDPTGRLYTADGNRQTFGRIMWDSIWATDGPVP